MQKLLGVLIIPAVRISDLAVQEKVVRLLSGIYDLQYAIKLLHNVKNYPVLFQKITDVW